MNCELRQAAVVENPDSAGGPVLNVSEANVASDSARSGIQIADDQMAVVRNFLRDAGVNVHDDDESLPALAATLRRQMATSVPPSGGSGPLNDREHGNA